MSWRATEFEFRNRFWIISGTFCLGFGCYAWDHMNMSVALARMILGDLNSPLAGRWIRAILAVGVLLVTLAVLVRSWAAAYLHSSVVHDSLLHSERLVADGPYRRVRNPLYLGNILLAVGMGPMASRMGFLVLVAGTVPFVYRLILREEAGLLESQGDSYRRYFETVPRLWPSWRPRVPAGGGRPNWVDGFVGETCMWGLAIGMAVFDVTLRLAHFWIIMGTGFAVYFVQAWVRKRRAGSVWPLSASWRKPHS
jgi:protein-S-isoprenylcysteine O-methyltransferase Ste14